MAIQSARRRSAWRKGRQAVREVQRCDVCSPARCGQGGAGLSPSPPMKCELYKSLVGSRLVPPARTVENVQVVEVLQITLFEIEVERELFSCKVDSVQSKVLVLGKGRHIGFGLEESEERSARV